MEAELASIRVTLRRWLGTLIGVQLPFHDNLDDREQPQRVLGHADAALPFLCWLPNLCVAEWFLRRHRPVPAEFSVAW